MLPHSDSIHKEFVILNEIIFCPPPWRVFLESIEHVRRHKGEAYYYLANNSGTPRHGVKILSSLLFNGCHSAIQGWMRMERIKLN